MDRAETKKLREWFDRHRSVLVAYETGSDIEYRHIGGEWTAPGPDGPRWQECCEYRVKPAPKLRAYTDDEMAALVGKLVKQNQHHCIYVVTSAILTTSQMSVTIGGTPTKAGCLLANYTHLDGSPLGILEG